MTKTAHDEYLAIFGIAAYGGPALAVAKAWAQRQQIGQALQQALSANQAWPDCRAALLSMGAHLELPLPSTDEEGLRPLARMFARRFLAGEVTMEVLIARLQRNRRGPGRARGSS